MLHHTKQQVFRPSACKQTAAGVYRTLIVQLCHILVEVAAVHLVQHAQSHNTSSW